MSITRISLSLAMLIMLAHGVGAQDRQQKRQQKQQQQAPQQQQQLPQQQQAPQQRAAPGGAGTCVPSGFARLTRKCSVKTGACQRLPENCNRGWCCP